MNASHPLAGQPARRNIELKARCPDLARAAAAAKDIGATRAGELRQCDTYFHVPTGRLKLRETDGKPAELIAYARADSPEFRDSRYHLVPAPDPAALKTALASVLGVRGEVRKVRELWMYHNVRIHLDAVAGLGTFTEFEAVISSAADEAASQERLETLTSALGIGDDDRISVSYSDLAGL